MNLSPIMAPRSSLRLWDDTGANYGSDQPRFTITVKSLDVLKALLWNPTEITLGDAFVKGDLEVEGDIFAMFEFADFVFSGRSRRESSFLCPPPRHLRLAKAFTSSRVSRSSDLFAHSLRRDKQAISYHYDKPPEFFAPWLGPTMVYSCAYFCRNSESLEEAQRNKLDLICKKLRLQSRRPDARHRLRLGQPHPSCREVLRRPRHRHHAQRAAVRLCPAAHRQGRVSAAECEVRLCDYRELDHTISQPSTRSPASACSSTSAGRTSAPTSTPSKSC